MVGLVGVKARVQRTGFQVVLARKTMKGRSKSKRESCTLAHCFKQSDLDTAHRRLVESECPYGAPPMSMVSDDFGLRYLIFHSFRERYTQAFISVINMQDAKV